MVERALVELWANGFSNLISDAAGYINGEVVTIDGGEWIGGAGEFNQLSLLTSEEWDEISALTRGKKEGGEGSNAH